MRWLVALLGMAGCVADPGEEECFEFAEDDETRCGVSFEAYDDCEIDAACSAYRESPASDPTTTWFACDDGWASQGRGGAGGYEFSCHCYPSTCVGSGLAPSDEPGT